MNYFKGKLVYITGGTSGIGLEMGKLLAAESASCVLIARNVKRLEETKKTLESLAKDGSQKIYTVSVDVSDHRDVTKKMKAAASKIGAPDILINSAGINKYADRFENITPEMFDEVMKTNVNGVRNMIYALIEPMKRAKTHIVILSSAAGLFGMFGYTNYATSKAALIGFAESLRYELKPRGMHITVIYPPEVDTPMNYEEAKTLPPEGRAMKNASGFMTPQYAAKVILKAVAAKKFMYIPGLQVRFFYTLHRLTNGWISRTVSDAIVRKAQKKIRG